MTTATGFLVGFVFGIVVCGLLTIFLLGGLAVAGAA